MFEASSLVAVSVFLRTVEASALNSVYSGSPRLLWRWCGRSGSFSQKDTYFLPPRQNNWTFLFFMVDEICTHSDGFDMDMKVDLFYWNIYPCPDKNQ